MSDRFERLRSVLDRAVNEGITPGAVAHVQRGDDLGATIAVGHLGSHTSTGALARVSTSAALHYDLASLTKVLSTTTLVAQAVSEDRLSLGARPPSRWRGATAEATLSDLLAHRGGLEAHREFFVGRSAGDRPALMDAIAGVAPATKIGPVVYSDLGFLILGDWLEDVFEAPLDRLFSERVAGRLGLDGRVGFRGLQPLGLDALDTVAPTEVYDDRLHVERGTGVPTWFALRRDEGFAHGRVHDDNAVIAGGVAGHAGLFGDAEAVAMIAAAWLRTPDRMGITPEVRDRFWTPVAGTRRLGWDGPSPDGSGSTGRALSPRACGHLGFTGTSAWVDPDADAVFVLLTNRVHPTRLDDRIRRLRREFHQCAADALGI